MIIYAPSVVVCILGLLVYALASNPKVQTLGDRAFFAGLLALLLLGVIGRH